jgi:pimeloyl-ACP methyl ester carboxylesterase
VSLQRWRGLKALVHDTVDRVTELVGEGHESAARTVMKVAGVIEPLAGPARAVDEVRRVATQGILGTIRAVNRAVEVATDAGMDTVAAAVGTPPDGPLVPMRSDVMKSWSWAGDAALGAVNGVLGDTLHARENGLDLGMWLRLGDAFLPEDPEALRAALVGVGPRLAVFVHGLATTEWSWCLAAEAYHGDPAACFGALLQRDLGYTPVFARYNTGRHVSENGRLLSLALERVVAAMPEPLEEIVLFGHSMGGLVVRSACHEASVAGRPWVGLVGRVFCLGSPHHGAPLEKVGHVLTAVLGAIDTPGTRIPASILRGRSAGIKDLRHGALVDEDWRGVDVDALRGPEARDIPLLPGVRYHFVSATVTADPEHPVGQIIGDLLVRVPSATGERLDREVFPIETRRFGGVLHHELQNHPAVYAQVLAALGGCP